MKNNRKRWKNGQNKSPKVSLRRLNQSPEQVERNIFLLTTYNIAAPTGKTITMMILMMRTEKRVLDSMKHTMNLGSMAPARTFSMWQALINFLCRCSSLLCVEECFLCVWDCVVICVKYCQWIRSINLCR